jgi:hypothetical protein
MQHAGVGFKEANIIVRDGNFRPACGDARRVQLLNIQIKRFRAAFDAGEKRRMAGPRLMTPVRSKIRSSVCFASSSHSVWARSTSGT